MRRLNPLLGLESKRGLNYLLELKMRLEHDPVLE